MTGVRFDHIAIAAYRIADAPGVRVGVLGGEPLTGGPSAAYTWTAWRYANGGCLEVLEPRGSEAHGALIYRWPQSPMRLAVEIAPDDEEGPLAIEFTTARLVDLPQAPVRALGTVFRRSRP